MTAEFGNVARTPDYLLAEISGLFDARGIPTEPINDNDDRRVLYLGEGNMDAIHSAFAANGLPVPNAFSIELESRQAHLSRDKTYVYPAHEKASLAAHYTDSTTYWDIDLLGISDSQHLLSKTIEATEAVPAESDDNLANALKTLIVPMYVKLIPLPEEGPTITDQEVAALAASLQALRQA